MVYGLLKLRNQVEYFIFNIAILNTINHESINHGNITTNQLLMLKKRSSKLLHAQQTAFITCVMYYISVMALWLYVWYCWDSPISFEAFIKQTVFQPVSVEKRCGLRVTCRHTHS